MHCLLCDEYISEIVSWYSFFIQSQKRYICELCERELTYILGEICEDCGRSFDSLSDEYREGVICRDCAKWRGAGKFQLVRNRSVYDYNDWMKEVLARFKFRGDAELVQVFRASFVAAFQKYFANCQVVIPVPLSKEREYERGFNQAELLASCLPIQMLQTSLSRNNTEKQSKKRRVERLSIANPFYFQNEESFAGKRILLIDDVYTTGITVRQVGQCLYDSGAQVVSSLTLCRG
ncbi:ComF family protein [Bacillus gaemokensis]|uniref:Competence protein ComF n=1 Tax=Bacillus gaemokensis TaxID=574375 RepID=A0A073KFU4_9BACI|nr:ComF family protein [Bacillus gaemokensis]KEK25386.1 competence protein ComF [Bacillus gaemokensis]KYG37172.1 competence protein ComF [Bacillus gaemokensis]